MKDTAQDIVISVEHGNVLTFQADILALKFADDLYGADFAVVQALNEVGLNIYPNLPMPSSHFITSTKNGLSANQVLFLGVGPLLNFGYKEIRAFGRSVLEVLSGETSDIRHIMLTIHGPGYGLDEQEAFESELGGLIDAIDSKNYPLNLEKITIVEFSKRRVKRLRDLLEKLLPDGRVVINNRRAFSNTEVSERLRSVGYDSQGKPHIFVAMPFVEQMDDTFEYGIKGPVNEAGFLCERADLEIFTGDVLQWVKKRIDSAALVIADLSHANPNVYLEVGYAWGCGRPTILIAKDTEKLKFNVRGQRYLKYKRIQDLEKLLKTELENLKEKLF